MEKVTNALADQKLLSVFDNKSQGLAPNKAHYWMAHQLQSGQSENIYTTNFDTFIEEAYNGISSHGIETSYHPDLEHTSSIGNLDSDIQPKLIKLHGCISDMGSIAVTMKSITAERNEPSRKKALDRLFIDQQKHPLLILGYSFSDNFDITPLIEGYQHQSKTIYFVSHDEKRFPPEICPLSEVENINGSEEASFNPLKAVATADSLWIRGDTSLILGLQKPSEPPSKAWVLLLKNILDKTPLEQKLIAASWLYMDLEKLEEARDNLEKIVSKSSSTFYQAQAHLDLAKICTSQGACELSFEHLDRARSFCDDPKFITQVHIERSSAFSDLGKYKNARKELEAALSISEAGNDKQAIAQVKGHIGGVELLLGNSKEATTYFNKSYEYFKSHGYTQACVILRKQFAEIEEKRGNFDRAATQYEKARFFASKYGGKSLFLDLSLNLANWYRKTGEFEKAQDLYRETKDEFESIENWRRAALAENDLGKLLWEIGLVTEAAQSFEAALSLAKRGKDAHLSAILLNNQGTIHQGHGRLKVAIECYQKAESYFRSEENIDHLITNYCNQSVVYDHLNDLSKALEYANLAVELSSKTDDGDLIGNCILAKAEILRRKGEHKQALELFKKATECVIEVHSKVIANQMIALHLDGMELYPEAAKHYEQAIQISGGNHINLPYIHADYAVNLAEQEKMIEAQKHARLAVKKADKQSEGLARSLSNNLQCLLED